MTPSRPYFVRAVYEWVLDNQMTPYLLVNADYPMVEVPSEFVNAGKIVLNLAPSAIRELQMGNDFIAFSARFSGRVRQLTVPLGSVLAVYAKENGKGMFFDDSEIPPPDDGGDDSSPPSGGRPALKVVK